LGLGFRIGAMGLLRVKSGLWLGKAGDLEDLLNLGRRMMGFGNGGLVLGLTGEFRFVDKCVNKLENGRERLGKFGIKYKWIWE
jgi:hypothetical protein